MQLVISLLRNFLGNKELLKNGTFYCFILPVDCVV